MIEQTYAPQILEQIFSSHDSESLAQLDAYVAALPWNEEALRLGRALANYEDQRGWHEKACRRLEAMLPLATVEPRAQAELHIDLAEHAFRWGEVFAGHLEALQRLKSEPIGWEAEARRLRINALHAALLGANEGAQTAASKALAIYQEHADHAGRMLMLNTLAYIYLMARRPTEALEFTQMVLQSDPANMKVRADALMNHGYALRRAFKNADKSALSFYQEAVEIHRQRRDPLEMARACGSLEALYAALGDFPAAVATLREGLTFASQAHILAYTGVLFNNLMVLNSNWKNEKLLLADFFPFVQQWGEDFCRCAANADSRREEVRQFAASTGEINKILEPGDRNQVLRLLAHGVPLASSVYAGELAYACIVLARAGGDSQAALGPILERFQAVLPDWEKYLDLCWEEARSDPELKDQPDLNVDLVIEYFGEGVAATHAEINTAIASLRSLGEAVVVLLSRSTQARLEVKQRQPLRDRIHHLAPSHQQIGELDELLELLDDEELLVLRPGMKRGFRVKISGSSGNFQLHLLLADALIGDPGQGWLPGTRPDPRLVIAAHGGPVDKACNIAAGAFNLVNWEGIQVDGTVSADPDYWIWGEGIPSDIHLFQGQRVILLAPPPYQRSWTMEQKFPDLEGRLEVLEILSPAQVEMWQNKLLAGVQ